MQRKSDFSFQVFILAGGKSSRMGGRDKARLPLGNRSFLDRISDAARELGAPVQVIWEDVIPGCGPLGGVLTAFRRFSIKRALFLSCDMPLISPELLAAFMEGCKGPGAAAFTRHGTRAGFPLLLEKGASRMIEKQIASGEYSLQTLARNLNASSFEIPSTLRWQAANVNTPADYKKAVAAWKERRRSDAVLEIRELTVRRGKNELVSRFSWRVGKGEHWAVLGANGCGKTSLFSSLVGYLTPTRGEVFLFGQEYGDADWPALRKRIGLVSSSVRQMMPDDEMAWITVASGKYAMIDFWGTPRKQDRTAALKILRAVEGEQLAERPWMYLSQGERQRVLIGRALMANPALLILDEPCAGLDPAAREHFLGFLERLGRSNKSPSIILVTHHVEEIMPVFTHVLLIKAGRKLAEGPMAEMLTSKNLTEAFSTTIRLSKIGGRFALRVAPDPALVI